MKLKQITLLFLLFGSTPLLAQTNETPENLYQWKNKKSTELQPGYVILRSGKRLEGKISLIGSYASVEEVEFVGDGKEIKFPAGALNAYGLNARPTAASTSSSSSQAGIISDSPESLFEWTNGGIVMDKVVTNSVPRDGYVVTKSGEKIEGKLKVQKRDDELWNFQIKNGKDKRKFKREEVYRYGLTVSADQIEQSNLAKVAVAFYPGTVMASTEVSGEIGLIQSSFKTTKIILKKSDGTLSEYSPAEAKSFQIQVAGQVQTHIAVGEVFVLEEFNGNVFQLYRNPNPTTINQFATNLVKTGAEVGTQIAASAIVKKDAEKNDYITNMDSVIRVSSKDELIALRDGLVQLGGYSSVEEMQQFSDNESLKNNVSAIEMAIAGKELAQSEEGLYNKEWIITNKNTGVKTVIYRNEYEQQIEPILYGCYEYLSLDKTEQKEYKKWKNLNSTIAFLDKCY